MLGPIGLPEILFILVIALLVFGPKRLPKVGRTLGKALGEFRRATDDLKHSINREINVDVDSAVEPARSVRRPESIALPQAEESSALDVDPDPDVETRSAAEGDEDLN